MPQYMLLLRGSTTRGEDLGPEEIQAIIGRYMAWSQALREKNRLLGGEKLHDRSGRVLSRAATGQVVLRDGPFAETKETIGGYFLLECRDYDEAVELARTCPHLELCGTIEVRQIEEV